MSNPLSEQEIVRRESLQKLIDLGINPYPSELFEVTASACEIKEAFSSEKQNFEDIKIAGCSGFDPL